MSQRWGGGGGLGVRGKYICAGVNCVKWLNYSDNNLMDPEGRTGRRMLWQCLCVCVCHWGTLSGALEAGKGQETNTFFLFFFGFGIQKIWSLRTRTKKTETTFLWASSACTLLSYIHTIQIQSRAVIKWSWSLSFELMMFSDCGKEILGHIIMQSCELAYDKMRAAQTRIRVMQDWNISLVQTLLKFNVCFCPWFGALRFQGRLPRYCGFH